MSRTNYVTLSAMETTGDLWKAFGKWLQDEREKTGTTQEQVADETGMNVKSISRIERGEGGTKRKTVIRIVEAINELTHGYKVNLDEALRRAGFSSVIQDSESVDQMLNELPPDERNLVRKQVKALIKTFVEVRISAQEIKKNPPE